jgi:hypothetical protein
LNYTYEIAITFTIGYFFALWCGIQLERSRIHYKKYAFQKEGKRLMKNLFPGKIVYAADEFHGSYIGEVVGTRTSPVNTVQVRILACLSYPRQYAEIFTDKQVERKPYPYYSIQNFAVDNVGGYVGAVPDYHRSIINALNIAIKKCRPVELAILLRHCNRIGKESRVCAG